MVDDPHYGINGLSVPDRTIIRDQAIKDETTLFLEGSNGNLE
jgi:hypothetical protein